MSSSPIAATSTIAVHAGVWPDPELAAMVAPPVVVSSVPIVAAAPAPAHDPWRRGQLARSRANMPVGRHRGANR